MPLSITQRARERLEYFIVRLETLIDLDVSSNKNITGFENESLYLEFHVIIKEYSDISCLPEISKYRAIDNVVSL